MAAPNIVNVSTITAKTTGQLLTTTNSTDILTNTAASGKVIKVNLLTVANTTNVAVTAGVRIIKASGTSIALAFGVSVPVGATLDILARPLYLEEGDKISADVGTASGVAVLVSYEEIS